MIFREKLQFCLEIKTCDPLNYTMDHSKLIASIQKEEFISSFKISSYYYIQQQSLNYMYMMKHQILWISCCCHSLSKLYLMQIMQVSCWKHTCYEKFLVSMKSIFSNLYWMGKPAAQ